MRRRRGVASVIGMLFMTLVFMAGIGAQVYISGQQAQAEQASSQQQLRLAEHSDELLLYTTPTGGLTATDAGPSSVELVGMVMKFENGTQYLLSRGSTPAFQTRSLPQGSALAVASLVPSGRCLPGAESCLSRFDSIVKGTVPGRAVGLLTSLGNVFWFVPSAATVQWSEITG
jgi:hypothetical protein